MQIPRYSGLNSSAFVLRRACALLAGAACAASWVGCGPPVDAARAPILNAQESYQKRTCYRCHGRDREGTEIGPPLHDLAQNWDVDRLARYIEDPDSFRKNDPRLEQLVEDYKGKVMKGYRLAESERRALAEWLLSAGPR